MPKTKTTEQLIKEKVKSLSNAFDDLLEVVESHDPETVENCFSLGYPFQRSFDEECAEVSRWAELTDISSYFINMDEDDISIFADALSDSLHLSEPHELDIYELVMQYSGDSCVRKVHETDYQLLIVSEDSAITVLNVVDKSTRRIVQSIELE